MFCSDELRNMFYLSTKFQLETLRVNKNAFWFHLLTISDITGLDDVIIDLITEYPILMDVTDQYDHRVLDVTNSSIRSILIQKLLWFGRYRIIDVRPLYVSTTCHVYRAIDEKEDDDHDHMNKIINYGLPFVVLKIIFHKCHFLREISFNRNSIDNNYVVNIIQSFPSVSDNDNNHDIDLWPEYVTFKVPYDHQMKMDPSASPADHDSITSSMYLKSLSKEEAESAYCIVMPHADGNLYISLKQEYMAFSSASSERDIRLLLTHVIRGVMYVHSQGYIHCDILPMNIVRFGVLWKLIDFDLCCQVGTEIVDLDRCKTAYVPPEALYYDSDLNKVAVKSMAGYELLIAHESFDVWSLGCILYQLCTKDTNPLFYSGTNDMLSEDRMHEDSMWDLYEWSIHIKCKKLARVKYPTVRHLLSRMLSKNPAHRPTLSAVLSHMFFAETSNNKMTINSQLELLTNQRPYDIYLSTHHNCDMNLANDIYDSLRIKQLHVWWSCKNLAEDNASGDHVEDQSFLALSKCRVFVCFLSKESVNNTHECTHNFKSFSEHSKCDTFLLELRFALELYEMGIIQDIYPIWVGESILTIDDILPSVPDVIIASLENHVKNLMQYFCLGCPLNMRSVSSMMAAISLCPGYFIAFGQKRDSTLATVCNLIANLVMSSCNITLEEFLCKREMNREYYYDVESSRQILKLSSSDVRVPLSASTVVSVVTPRNIQMKAMQKLYKAAFVCTVGLVVMNRVTKNLFGL